eukprot:110480_1
MHLNAYTWPAYSVCGLGVIAIFAILSVIYRQYKRVPISVRRCTYTYKDNGIDFWCGMKCKDIRSACLKFIGLNTTSQILNLSAQQDLWRLFCSHLNCKSYHKILSMPLLYSATQQTFNCCSFLSKIANKKNIVILMKNEHNHIFGGYSCIGLPSEHSFRSISRIAFLSAKSYYNGHGWRPPLISRYLCDPKSFIFCVQSRLHSKPIIFKRSIVGLETDIGACFDTAFEFGTEDMILKLQTNFSQRYTFKAICLRSRYYHFDAKQFGSANEQGTTTMTVKCKLNMIEVFQMQI